MLKLEARLSLAEAMHSPNIAEHLSGDDLKAIGDWCVEGYQRDKRSRSKWETRMQAAMDLALQVTKTKTFPWPGAANVAFPLVTIAALQFHSRAYPALVQAPDIVSYRVTVPDPQGQLTAAALRVGRHMSWQVLEQDESWEESHDRLLISVPIVGCAFKKTYYDPTQRSNTSELVLAQDMVLDYYAKSVETCSRKTQRYTTSRNDIHSSVEDGRFRDCREEPWYNAPALPNADRGQARADARTGESPPLNPDEASDYTLIEQHCSLDLDGDGYAEPYIVTVEPTSRFILRIVARWDSDEQVERNIRGRVVRIRSTEYYTKYGFIPSPDGGIYDLGFGILLGPLNSTVNALCNQILDAGTVATTSGGFLGRGVNLRGGQYSFNQFGWNRVDSSGDDLHKNIFPLPVREPSKVLFEMLGFIVQYAGRIAGSTDTMVGENPGQNTPAQTTQTMVEQGMKIYNAIFKRIWRSMKHEFRKLFLLNAHYLPDTQAFGGAGMQVLKQDYKTDPRNICPAADPNVASEAQRLKQAIALKQAAATTPGYNVELVERRFLRAMGVMDADQLYPGPGKVPPLPNPKAMVEQMKLQMDAQRLQWDKQKFILELKEKHALNLANISKLEAQAHAFLAQAKGTEAGHQIAAFNAAIGALKEHDASLRAHIDQAMRQQELDNANQPTGSDANPGGMGGMEAAPGHAGPHRLGTDSAGGGAGEVGQW